jgi:hypothetical protein
VTSLALALAGCGGSAMTPPASVGKGSASATPTRTDVPAALRDVAMPRPGKVKTPLFTQDLLVYSQNPLPAGVVSAIKAVKGVQAAEQFSMASFYVEEQQVTYAAVAPDTFRRYLPATAAQDAEVWDRVADGELAVDPKIRDAVALTDDTVQMGNAKDAPSLHIGALTPLNEELNAPFINAVVNERWASKLHMPEGNALLISTGQADPVAMQPAIAKLAGDQASVKVLGPGRYLNPRVAQTAVLTGGSVAQAVGSFTYTVNADGSVNPDPRWIAQYIRTEQVPILGAVRCNKAMLPQLRAALTDVVKLGLASKIHPQEYGGCYVPRYIGHDPSQGLSFPATSAAPSAPSTAASWRSSTAGASTGAAAGGTRTRCTSRWRGWWRCADARPIHYPGSEFARNRPQSISCPRKSAGSSKRAAIRRSATTTVTVWAAMIPNSTSAWAVAACTGLPPPSITPMNAPGSVTTPVVFTWSRPGSRASGARR